MLELSQTKIAIIGLGYVGLPLAVGFSEKYEVIGFDVNQKRIDELKNGIDITNEVPINEIQNIESLIFTSSKDDLKECNIYIVTVPTPVDANNNPDITMLISASKLVGEVISTNNIVIYESTVYPGATEDDCIPVIESISGLKLNNDFFAGYSPERINPGDKNRRLKDILKITSGSNKESAKFIDKLYGSIIDAGTHLTSSIKVAEAAKVIENTQRDVNIALINELAIIFNTLEIDTLEVLEAAGTKWNFLSFRPGLVGGHCIGVDPYYLTYKAESVGFKPKMILAGRNLNDGMSLYVVQRLIEAMEAQKIQINNANILVMGLTFKEDCPDVRNSKIVDIYKELKKNNCQVDVYDPHCSKDEALMQHNITLINEPNADYYDAIILAVAHNSFKKLGSGKIKSFGKENHVLYDLKYLLDKGESDLRL